jgi:nitroreductase
MELKKLVLNNRTYRRFDQTVALSVETLSNLVDLARQAGCSGNKQSLRYLISTSPEMNARIFSTLAWAGALRDWPGPEEGERPTGYIMIAADQDSWWDWGTVDVGIVAQTILLAAVDQGLGGCMIGSFKKKELSEIVALPEGLEMKLVIALGKPVEEVVLEEASLGDSLAYYRSTDRVHHVPKLKLRDVLVQTW